MMVSLDTQHSMFSFPFPCVMFYDLHISIRDMYLLFLFHYFWFSSFEAYCDRGSWGWDRI